MRRSLALLFLSLAGFHGLFAAERVECDALQSAILRHPVRYCALLPDSFDGDAARRYPILYELHGLGQNEQSLLNLAGWELIDQVRAQGSLGEFLTVTPAADATFYVNSRDGRVRYEDFFIREFMPYIERRYRAIGGREARGIGGVSMGGYGALHYAFKYPRLFSVVAVNSAALIENVPAGLRIGGFNALAAFGHPLDAAYWNANSPFTLAKRSAAALRAMKIYFDCGTNDDYGFEAGAQSLHLELRKLGIEHAFHLYPGRHNLAYFEEHLPAAIGFEARAVAGTKSRVKPKL